MLSDDIKLIRDSLSDVIADAAELDDSTVYAMLAHADDYLGDALREIKPSN
jgi:hypothetical protein